MDFLFIQYPAIQNPMILEILKSAKYIHVEKIRFFQKNYKFSVVLLINEKKRNKENYEENKTG